MGDATRGSPIPLRAGIKAQDTPRKITHLRYMRRPASVLQSDHRLAGHPLSPSKDWRPGFSIGLVPILTGQAHNVADGISIPSSAPPGPYGPARCGLSRRRELRVAGVLGSSVSRSVLSTVAIGKHESGINRGVATPRFPARQATRWTPRSLARGNRANCPFHKPTIRRAMKRNISPLPRSS
jgi:hypothetical protein